MKTLINDTCEVVFKRKSDNKLIFTAESQLSDISQSVQEDKLKGGIGNRTLAVLRSDKEITLKVKNALFDLDWLSMTQGVNLNPSGTATVYAREDNLVVSGTTTLTVTITGTPIGTSVTLINAKGETVNATVASKSVTVPSSFGVVANNKVSVIYQQNVTGNVLSIDSKTFSEQYSVEYHTIEYDPSSNLVIADLYFQFDNVLPSGTFDLSFQNGTALTPELSFTTLATSSTTEIGRVIEVIRS